MTFRTETGVEVPLETLADLRVSRTLGQIRREGRQTMLQITAKAPRADSRRLFEAVDKAMADFEMPRGYRWDKGREYREAGEQEKAMMFAGGLAITFVFLLMGLLFESFVLPLAVITAVPFAYLGVVWTLYLTETPLDMMARIGIVILVGVVVNNAIVLVDMANRLRAEGLDRFSALIDAGRHRFRPIMMTTLAAIFGAIPIMIGAGAGGLREDLREAGVCGAGDLRFLSPIGEGPGDTDDGDTGGGGLDGSAELADLAGALVELAGQVGGVT